MERFNWVIAAVLLSTFTFGAAMAVEQAGVTAAVRGEVSLDPVTGEAAHAVESGEDVFLGDGISSGDASGLQLMLLDETIFTVGENTDLTIDEFVYDPATGVGRMSASLTKGIFRFVAGNIAQGDPADMTINLPTGTIGIRGTTGLVGALDQGGIGPVFPLFEASDLDPEGFAAGLFILSILLETEENEDADKKGMVVSAQGESVELTVPGWGTIIAPGQPPSPPFFAPDVLDMGNILGDLSAAPVDTLVERTDDISADDSGGAIEIEMVALSLVGPGGLQVPVGDPESCCTPIPIQLPPDTGFDPCEFLTCFEDMPTAGTATYSANGVFTQTLKNNNSANIQGTFSASLDIDFTNRQFCFGGCSISVNTSSFGGNISDSTGVNTADFDGEVGFAGGVLDSDDLTNNKFTGTSVGLINSDGIVANQNTILILYDDGSGNQGAGAGLSDPAVFSP